MAGNDNPAKRKPAPAGTILRASGKDGPQIVASAGARWTDAARRRFLDFLAASCNVTRACAESGFSKAAVYRRRRLDPAFAADWEAALAQGYARLEMALVRAAADRAEGYQPDPEAPFAAMTVREALEVLKLYRAVVKGDGGRLPGWRARPRSLDEVRDSILTKLAAFDRYLLRPKGVDGRARRAG
jgi:hypothetical protein